MGSPIIPPISPVTPPSQQAGGTCSFRASDIVTMAMQEIGAIDPNENPTGPEMNAGLVKLNRLLDAWNADRRYIYTVNFSVFTLQPNLQPHTIGPTGTFVVPQRPEKLVAANVLLNYPGNTSVRQPCNVRDADWWANKAAYAVVATFPTDVYYEPDWNNGSLFFWPVPNTAYPIELETWTVLAQLQLSSTFCMPPGYMDAVVYSLAEALCPSFGKEVSPTLDKLRTDAIRRIQYMNSTIPRMGTKDAGMPRGNPTRPYFNYLTGQSVGNGK